MKRKLFIVLLLLAIAGAATWYFDGIHGDGIIKTEDRPVADFSKVTITGAYTIIWSRGKTALSITTDQNLLPHITSDVSNGTLRIRSEKSLHPTKNLSITLSSDSLTEADLTGANTFKAAQLSGPELKIHAAGASTIHLDGSVTKLDVHLTGANKLHAESLQAQTANVSVTGASSAHVNVTEALKASITGAGSITYSGHPLKTEQSITGIGSIRPQP